MTRRFKRWLAILSGWFFIALGVAGLFLPFLQGILFLVIGITILSAEYVWARKLLQNLRERFPSLSSRLDSAKTLANKHLKRIFPGKPDNEQD